MDTIIQPVIRPAKRGGYRRHTDEFKRAVVAQSLLADASVSRVAREHNINANQVFVWRKLFREGRSSHTVDACALLPGPLAAVAAPDLSASCADRSSELTGIIELTVGKAKLRLEGCVASAALTLVLQRLLP
jgi:transposase